MIYPILLFRMDYTEISVFRITTSNISQNWVTHFIQTKQKEKEKANTFSRLFKNRNSARIVCSITKRAIYVHRVPFPIFSYLTACTLSHWSWILIKIFSLVHLQFSLKVITTKTDYWNFYHGLRRSLVSRLRRNIWEKIKRKLSFHVVNYLLPVSIL